MNIEGIPPFSIVIPTYQEADNITALLKRIAATNFQQPMFEVIFVDDNSNDGIEQVVQRLANKYAWVKLVVRHAKRDLSQAVIEGCQVAQYPLLVVMDADLSHPPEKIPEMLQALSDTNVDFVIGSRFISHGSTDERWPVRRKISSQLAAIAARILLAADIKDPLSGFFTVKKTTLAKAKNLAPIGWKIGLEIMIKCHCNTIKEIPIHFSQRHLGKSKLSASIIFKYLRHLIALATYILSTKLFANIPRHRRAE